MVDLDDVYLDPEEAEIYDYCSFCKSPIYKGEHLYTGLEVEACEECKIDFLRYSRRVAE